MRVLRIGVVLLAATALLAGSQAGAQLADKKGLTLAAARTLAAAAEAEATKNNWKMVIVIVDDGGHLLYLERMDEVQIGSVQVAIDKARSAAQFKRPTKVFEDAVAGGRNALLGLHGAVPIEGGVPIMNDGKMIGAIGASGGTAPQDGQVAKAGVDALPKAMGR
jgi:glc operon protein GlcG